MAYMNQEKKAKIAAEIKKVIPKGWKYSLSVRNHSTITCTIQSAPIDLIAEIDEARKLCAERQNHEYYPVDSHADINVYHYENQLGESKEIIGKIISAMNTGNWDKSDYMTDYFNVGHYVNLQVGKWNKPFTKS